MRASIAQSVCGCIVYCRLHTGVHVWYIRYRQPKTPGLLPATSPKHLDRLWYPPILFSWHRGLFPLWQNGRKVKLTTHLHIQPLLGPSGSVATFPHILSGCAQ